MSRGEVTADPLPEPVAGITYIMRTSSACQTPHFDRFHGELSPSIRERRTFVQRFGPFSFPTGHKQGTGTQNDHAGMGLVRCSIVRNNRELPRRYLLRVRNKGRALEGIRAHFSYRCD